MNCWPYKADCTYSSKTQEPSSEALKLSLIHLIYAASVGLVPGTADIHLIMLIGRPLFTQQLPMPQFICPLPLRTCYSPKIQVSLPAHAPNVILQPLQLVYYFPPAS